MSSNNDYDFKLLPINKEVFVRGRVIGYQITSGEDGSPNVLYQISFKPDKEENLFNGKDIRVEVSEDELTTNKEE